MKLDVFVNEIMKKVFIVCEEVVGFVFEEDDIFILFDIECFCNVKYILMIDLFDGLLNIDVNVFVGMIFFIYKCVLLIGIFVMMEDFL